MEDKIKTIKNFFNKIIFWTIKRKKIITPFFLFILVFGIYLYTSPRLPTGYADSEELMAAAYTLGISHPPGYPLFVLLGKLFTFIPIGTIAFRFSIFSSFFGSLTVLLVFSIIRKITKKTVASFIGAFSLAFSYVFWLYSITPEVFFLTGFFVALIIFVLISWYQKKQKNEEGLKEEKNIKQKSSKYLYLFVFLSVLSFHTQQLIVFIAPAFLYFIYIIDKKVFRPSKKWLSIFISGIAGLLPLIYFPLAAGREPFIDYGNPTTPTLLWQLVSRYIYKLASREGSAYLPASGYLLKERIYQLLYYFVFLVDQFTPILVAVAFIGILFLFIKKSTRKVGAFLFLCFIFTGPVLALYASPELVDYPYHSYISFILPKYASFFNIKTASESYNSIGALERFYLMSFIAFSIFIGIGIFSLLSFLKRIKVNPKLLIIVTYLLFLIPAFPLRDNFAVVNKNNFYLGQDQAENWFLNIEPNAILITRGDRPTFAAYYYQQVEKKRLDVTIVSFGWRSWSVERLKKREPSLITTENNHLLAVLRNIIQTNIDKRPIYTTGLPNSELVQLGIAGDPFIVSPRGMVLKVCREFDLGRGDYWQKMIWHGPQNVDAYYDQYAKEIIEQYIIGHSNNYYHYRVRGYNELAFKELEAMLKIAPGHSLTRRAVEDWENFGRHEIGIKRELVLGEARTHFDLTQLYLKEKKVAEAMAEAWTAVYIEPENNLYRLQLARTYEMLGWYEDALKEYKQVLEKEKDISPLIEEAKRREQIVREKIIKRDQPLPPFYQRFFKKINDFIKKMIDKLNLKKPFH